VDVIALTTRDDFLLELGQALGGQASVTPVESPAQALEYLRAAKQGLRILAIDSRGLEDLRAAVETLHAQAPQIATLLFAETREDGGIAPALGEAQVFAMLAIPLDIARTAAVFADAVADSKFKRTAPHPATPQQATIVVDSISPAAPEPIRPRPPAGGDSKLSLRAIGGVVLAVVAAAGLWFLTRDRGRPAAQTETAAAVATQSAKAAPAIETSVVKGKVDELLEKARQAMRERRYAEPAGDNALLFYRSAAYADSANGEARDGLTRVASVLVTRFEAALAANQPDEASLTLAQLKSAVPTDARIGDFQSRLSKLHTDIQRTEQEQVRQKRLAEQQAAREAAAIEQKKAREAKAAEAEAERQAQLAREKERQEKLKLEQAPQADDAAKTAPKAANPPRPGDSLQSSLKRKRYVAPEYPESEQNKHVGGVVRVSFTVNVKGEPIDVQVEASEPAGVFDRAAVAAVKRWRYEPLVIDGVPTEVPVRLAIRFAP